MSKAAAAKQTEKQTRKVAPMQTRGLIEPGSANAEKRTVELVWSTGARVLRRGFMDDRYGSYYEELSLDPKHVRMDRLNNGAPLLDSHSSYSLDNVIGVVVNDSAKLESAKRGVATVQFSKRESAAPFFDDVMDGVIQNISVGYRVYRYERVGFEGEGESAIPIFRATDWEPYELSAVPIGADDGAGFRNADKADKNDCLILTQEEKRTMKTKAQIEAEKKKRAAEAALEGDENRAADDIEGDENRAADDEGADDDAPAPQVRGNDKKARADGVTQERARVEGINSAVRAAGLDRDFRDDLVKKGVTLDKARAAIIDKLAETTDKTRTDNHVRVEITDDENDKYVRNASDWLLTKAGVASKVEAHSKEKIEPGQFRGMSLLDMARDCIERRGEKTRGLSKMEIATRAFQVRSGNYQTTSDFAVLLENALHKTLLAAYAMTADTWSQFCVVGSVSDFRPHNRYRMGTFGQLDRLNENGEFKNKKIPDGEKELIQAATRGNIIGISRQAIVNDDMDAFSRLATMFGRAAKLSIEMDVYALIALNSGLGPTMNDGNPLFDAAHNNISGSGAVPSVASFDAIRVKMASQRDPSGNEILDIRPSIMLCPIGLGGLARTINNAQYDPTSGAAFMSPNIVNGMFKKVVDTPRLSGTRWYALAAPEEAPTFEVAFLDGQTEPYMETQEGWRVDGMETKVRHDYAVAATDFRGAATDDGTP